MAKAKFDYLKEDVVRIGDAIGNTAGNIRNPLHLVLGRKLNIREGGMADWEVIGDINISDSAAQEVWNDVADHMRSLGLMTCCWVQVNNVFPMGQHATDKMKWCAQGTVRDVRSSALLKGDGGVPRTVAPGGGYLNLAVIYKVNEWMESQDQTADDAAKDQAYAPGTAPDLLPSKTDDELKVINDAFDDIEKRNPVKDWSQTDGEGEPKFPYTEGDHEVIKPKGRRKGAKS